MHGVTELPDASVSNMMHRNKYPGTECPEQQLNTSNTVSQTSTALGMGAKQTGKLATNELSSPKSTYAVYNAANMKKHNFSLQPLFFFFALIWQQDGTGQVEYLEAL